MKLLIPVAAGLEQTVKRQLAELGYEKAPAFNGKIELDGDESDIARLNIFLRGGERVCIKLAEFPASTFDELYDGFYALPWENYLTRESKILMDGNSVASRLVAIKAAGGVAKKAIIKRLADKLRAHRKVFPETGARTVVGCTVRNDLVTVTLDTTGDGLHKRGYRTVGYTAPLKETLAACLIDNTFYNPDRDEEKPFADPFTGSGTLPIEAALKALHIAPGINRSFDCEKWDFFRSTHMKRAREEAKDQELRHRKVQIYGGDISEQAISIARFHARQAGVEEFIRFQVADARKFTSTTPCGVLLSNPPYGERLLDKSSVQTLMREFGKTFRALPDWNAYIFTSLEGFERFFGKTADKKKLLSNAGLRCGLYSYFGKPPKERGNEIKSSKNP